MTVAALLLTALLFGGMTLYAFGFAAFLFTALPAETASPVIRRAFPHFYLFVIAVSAAAAAAAAFTDARAAWILLAVAVSTLPTRQILMPAINTATDSGRKRRFAVLHGLSVGVTLAHIALAGWALVRLAGA